MFGVMLHVVCGWDVWMFGDVLFLGFAYSGVVCWIEWGVMFLICYFVLLVGCLGLV